MTRERQGNNHINSCTSDCMAILCACEMVYVRLRGVSGGLLRPQRCIELLREVHGRDKAIALIVRRISVHARLERGSESGRSVKWIVILD